MSISNRFLFIFFSCADHTLVIHLEVKKNYHRKFSPQMNILPRQHSPISSLQHIYVTTVEIKFNVAWMFTCYFFKKLHSCSLTGPVYTASVWNASPRWSFATYIFRFCLLTRISRLIQAIFYQSMFCCLQNHQCCRGIDKKSLKKQQINYNEVYSFCDIPYTLQPHYNTIVYKINTYWIGLHCLYFSCVGTPYYT